MFNIFLYICQDTHELQAGHSCAGRSAAVGSAPVPEILWITASRYAQLSSGVAMAKIVVTVQKMTGEETVIEVDPQETASTNWDGVMAMANCILILSDDAGRWRCNPSSKWDAHSILYFQR